MRVGEHATPSDTNGAALSGCSLERLFGQAFATDVEGAAKSNFLSRFTIDDYSTGSVSCSDWNVVC